MKKIILITMLFCIVLSGSAYAVIPSVQVTTTVSPSEVAPGEDGFVQITITNVGITPADNIKVNLAGIDTPLKAVTYFSEGGLGGLSAGKTVSTIFKFEVPENTPKGLYSISFKISSCENSACRDTSQYAIVEVKNPLTDFEISFESAATGTSISVANVGISDALAVSITIPEQDQFEVLGTKTFFLGNLDSGDFTVADFNLISKDGKQGNLKVQISYTDSTGDRHTVTKEISIKLYEALIQTSQGISVWWYVLIVIVIAGVGVYFWKKRKKK